MTSGRGAPVRILFGGSFDPPTLAHRLIAECALASVPNAELVVVPAAVSPHKQDRTTTAARHRLAMARIAFEGLPRVRVSDEEIVRGGASYTVDTLQLHRDELGADARLYFLVGADALLSFGRWREPDRILTLAKIISVARPDFEFSALDKSEGTTPAMRARLRAGILDCRGPRVSSTEVRNLLRSGTTSVDSGTGSPLESMMDKRVLAYIEAEQLYRPDDDPGDAPLAD
ncbi:MAG: nicotinate (nicotinamide) nucleotide adenylyltransferase [Planctomycetes bacterium]|nr:nicotinate (nicotinamide) nucleotide adenylyltransferase [Planctomycetota bacterium]MCB9918677.1 nicotinate (nicotinamide) nucleotide adenylyltransferase [Planctomycetota bacterium]